MSDTKVETRNLDGKWSATVDGSPAYGVGATEVEALKDLVRALRFIERSQTWRDGQHPSTVTAP